MEPGDVEGDPGYPRVVESSRVNVWPDTLPEAWDLPNGRILVRSEYHEAERAALSANDVGTSVFMVTGNPEIDLFPSRSDTRSAQSLIRKDFSLSLFIRRLALKLPTA